MKYHILGEHSQMGRILTGYWYTVAACRRNHKRLTENETTGRTWRIVQCLTPNGICDCRADDTFETVQDD